MAYLFYTSAVTGFSICFPNKLGVFGVLSDVNREVL